MGLLQQTPEWVKKCSKHPHLAYAARSYLQAGLITGSLKINNRRD
jgi:hypothetical protein